ITRQNPGDIPRSFRGIVLTLRLLPEQNRNTICSSATLHGSPLLLCLTGPSILLLLRCASRSQPWRVRVDQPAGCCPSVYRILISAYRVAVWPWAACTRWQGAATARWMGRRPPALPPALPRVFPDRCSGA